MIWMHASTHPKFLLSLLTCWWFWGGWLQFIGTIKVLKLQHSCRSTFSCIHWLQQKRAAQYHLWHRPPNQQHAFFGNKVVVKFVWLALLRQLHAVYTDLAWDSYHLWLHFQDIHGTGFAATIKQCKGLCTQQLQPLHRKGVAKLKYTLRWCCILHIRVPSLWVHGSVAHPVVTCVNLIQGKFYVICFKGIFPNLADVAIYVAIYHINLYP